MKRSVISLHDLCDWPDLSAAFYRAAKGKRHRTAVRQFEKKLFGELSRLQQQVLDGSYRPEPMASFWINDPKWRLIHAPSFRDRVLHHALIYQVGPVLDRSLVDDTFACRQGRGTIAAVKRCQQHMQRFRWYVKVDMASYFASISHSILLQLLCRKFKDKRLLELFRVIVDGHQGDKGKGLPIGALTSQHFANYYLAGFDRLLLEQIGARGMVRYMDDVIWWVDDRDMAKNSWQRVCDWLMRERGLVLKNGSVINRSNVGGTFCGYRVLPQQIRLTRRMKRRIASNRARWEKAWLGGRINSLQLQAGISSVYSAARHANAKVWCKEQLMRVPPDIALEHV